MVARSGCGAMTLELTEAELEELGQALEAQQRQLIEELAHADSRAFRAMLRARAEKVERLLVRIERAAQEARIQGLEAGHSH